MAGRPEDCPEFRKKGKILPSGKRVSVLCPVFKKKRRVFPHTMCSPAVEDMLRRAAESLCRKSASPYAPGREGLRQDAAKGRRMPPRGKKAFFRPETVPAGAARLRNMRYFFLHATGAGALRRTAMHSARMLTAISSGVSAPMSSPMGACMRARSSSVKPLSLRPA